MVKGKSFLIGSGILVAIVILFVCFMGPLDVKALSKTPDETQPIEFRPDIVTFDNMEAFGKLEKTKAIFLHDQHTDALEKKNKDCLVCHKTEDGRMSPKFMRLKDVRREELTKIYCDNCTKCHTETIAAGEKAGPVKCDDCHKERPLIQSSRVPMGFDKSLHFRHYRAQKNKCDRCHHEYDKKSQKLFYAKGKEGTCRYCHKKEITSDGTEKVISMRFASHSACIDCHQKTEAKQMDAGPVRCAGCHDAQEQLKFEKVKRVPRLKRGQPDNVLIKTGDKKGRIPTMMRVPFSHKAHEEYNDTCRVCHLASLESCATCHPLVGSNKNVKNGKEISLETAFHKRGHQSSCTGCHESKQQDKNCAGCHGFMTNTRQQESSTCLRCHMVPLPERTGELSTSKAAKMAR
ncbi:MAG: cytochrome C, partial [Deltaproteobacteria bacterium]|nr:cytochrome C [Deltaproteobacteria bacterium]